MASPRGKGIFPETHPLYLGVTGFGQHSVVQEYMRKNPPRRILVLGTRLGEGTSYWDPSMVPSKGFIHVDINSSVPGVAFPAAPTFAVHAEIGAFLTDVIARLPPAPRGPANAYVLADSFSREHLCASPGRVRPQYLMAEIQRTIVESTDALVMAEAGNSFAWAVHFLRIPTAGRYRMSMRMGSMGHMTAGVIGAAQARNGKAVAIVGDGAMLMTCEISTAVHHQIPAVWIVLNDSRYNMCHQGMETLGLQGADADIPMTDFTMLARSMGAHGVRVECERDLREALLAALKVKGPFVVDVLINPDERAPTEKRNQGLKAISEKEAQTLSFPKMGS
ncbi:MAG TPA: thiamine pyrophosphate-dependent enzyme [Oligoflexus sp.]|uniref:thiamine pyrophosphate-dependent enzyme n=1 Tax=Oligoflexus sp. TaxID=1971216 RepID=UPI002D27BBD0|nr:thiamine pyrophosphate-dependent enzyme [Oligoflexus sp.]HYX39097.1 thiamine pyrophosphate-dependent enzyme [Oligoflexus sp.]